MLLTRHPRAPLRPFVKILWVMDETQEARSIKADREHVLPTGDMHLVFRLSDRPLRLFDNVADAYGRTLGHAIVGGVRTTFYVREISEPAFSVGAQLNPGAAGVLFGMPADELAERHTRLDDLWGSSAALAREQLLDARGSEQQLDMLESVLASRLPKVKGIHPAVAQALEQFTTTDSVRDVVSQSGYSHRRFIALFGREVGLTPKLYCRVRRFRRALERAAADPSVSLVDLALEAGYADQSHLSREFKEFSGVTPGEYREISPSFAHHVRVR